MNTAMITCPNCGTEIALSQALPGTVSPRERGAPRRTRRAGPEEKVRADFALEKQLLETQLAEERKKREVSQRAELELRKAEGRARRAGGRELDLEVARRVDGEKHGLEEAIRRGLAVQAGAEAQGEGTS